MLMHNPPHPGEILKELCLEPLGLTVSDAAKALGVSRKTLSAIVNGRAGISPEMAVRLSIAFGTSSESWLNQQTQLDLWKAEKHRSEFSSERLCEARGSSLGIIPVTDNACQEAIGYWKCGIQYLHLVEMVATEIIKQGNKSMVITNTAISPEEVWLEMTWADHNLVLPLLFTFYHGVEVLLKGFLVCRGNLGKKTHKLSDLLIKFYSKYPSSDIGDLLAKYIVQDELLEPLASFCAKSSITMDEYYQALKYPQNTAGSVFSHTPLKHRDKKGLVFFSQLRRDVQSLRLKAVQLGRLTCPRQI